MERAIITEGGKRVALWECGKLEIDGGGSERIEISGFAREQSGTK